MSEEKHKGARKPRLTIDRPGHTELLLGNHAIVRGAIEAGVGFASGYPGTPSTEVTDAFAKLAPTLGIPFEYSVNEKVALEMAFAAALSGARSIVAMKHLGLMYAGDPLSTIPYLGIVAGMVIVSAGDPSCFTSPNEQDQRHLADMLHIPLFDPRTPQEALDITRFAFELSERCLLPVILRPTTRVCHTMAPVTYGPIQERKPAKFERAPGRFVIMPTTARKFRLEINDRLKVARELIEESGFFDTSGSRSTAVLASGVPAATCGDLLAELGVEDEITLIELGVIFPLPEQWLLSRLREVDTLLVVEELSPYLEDRIRALISLHGLTTKVLGKRTGHLPEQYEYGPEIIQQALHQAFQVGHPPAVEVEHEPPAPRQPSLCPSCPHRSAFFVARSVFGDSSLYFNDIGCYTLGVAHPLNVGDALLCMGAGFTLAAGVARTTGERTLGFLGDSTFFHSGMPALVNAIKHDVNMVAVVMDNGVTAMTGFQESPAVEIEGSMSRRIVNIEGTVRALGAQHVETVDPYDLAATIAAFERARDRTGLSVIITERTCPVFQARARLNVTDSMPEPDVTTYRVDQDLCGTCGRASCGHRCDLETTESFERIAIRARALELDRDVPRPEVAPCAHACPLFLCVQGYASRIAAGDYEEALELILDAVPLPESVCRVCHRPCEAACVRSNVDEPIAINDLKRFVVQWAGARSEYPYRSEPAPANGSRVAIVGMGPAGLAAARELRKRGYEVHGFDAGEEPGGILRTGIPGYRLPPDAVRRDVARIMEMGVHFEGGRRLGDDLRIDDLLSAHDAVLLAVGAGRGKSLSLSGGGPEVLDALDYLRDPTGSPDHVVVIGGGNSAIDASRTALRNGAVRVTVACLEDRALMPAIPEEVHEAEREGVEIRDGFAALGLGADGVELTAVEPREPGVLDPDNFKPVPGTEEMVEADLVIVAIGQELDDSVLGGLGLERAGGLVRVDAETQQSSNPRVFAAGDLTSLDRTVVGAIATGLRAAWGIDRSLRGAEVADERMPPPLPTTPSVQGTKRWRPTTEARRRPPGLDAISRTMVFDEVGGTLSEEEARAEAARCLFCGLCGSCRSCLDLFGCPAFLLDGDRIAINTELCVACGVCAQFCPNGALVAVRDEGEAP